MTFLGKEWLGVTGLGSSACKIPSCFQSGSAELAPVLIRGGGSNPSDLRRRLGSAELHLPRQTQNPLPAMAADRSYSLSGYGGGPDRCVVKVPGIVPGKIPKPASISGKTTKSMVRYEEDASDPTAIWRIATAANHKADRVQQQKGDFQKVMTELHESMDRVEALLRRSVEDLCQINLNSTQGIQLMSTTEGNFKFPSTYPSVVVTGWGEDSNEVDEIQKDESALKGTDAKTKSNDPTEAPSQPVETGDMAQINIISKRGVQIHGIPDGNSNSPSTGYSAVPNCWGQSQLPLVFVASPTLNKLNPNSEPLVEALDSPELVGGEPLVGRADKRLRCTGLFWKLPPWPGFCALVFDRFAQHSDYKVLENSHSVKQYNHSVLNYTVKFEELLNIWPIVNEDYYARVEGWEITSNLSKAAGLATMAAMRPDIDEYVRNTTVRAFSMMTSVLGISALLHLLKAIDFIIPLIDAQYASYYTKEVMQALIREFQSPDEGKKIVLNVVKQCVSTEGVEADYILEQELEPMEQTVVKAKSCNGDGHNVDRKLRQKLEMTEDEAHFHMKQDESSACKYVILSKKVLAVFVVMNSTVSSSKEPGNIVFQTLTDAQNFYAMNLWFAEKARMESLSQFDHLHFLFPEIFKDLNKGVMLGDDVIVQRDLSFLGNLNMGDKVNGTVEFWGVRLDQVRNLLGEITCDSKSCAWMSGVNVTNLDNWRKHDVTEDYLLLLKKFKTKDTELFKENVALCPNANAEKGTTGGNDNQNQTDLFNWEDATEVSAEKLREYGCKHSNTGAEVSKDKYGYYQKKKYRRDFLVKFKQKLHANLSKCVFAASHVDYLGLEMNWDANPSIILDIKIRLGVSLPIQVKDIGFTGVLHLIFRPRVNELPCFGAVCFSLRQKKRLDFTLWVIGGEISVIPGISDALEDTIKNAIEDSITWPVRKVIPIIPGDYSDLELKSVGTVEVNLVQARDLTNKDVIGKSDPFAILYVRPLTDKTKRSKTINNDLNPIWNEYFEFIVEYADTQSTTVKIYDDDGIQELKLQLEVFFSCVVLRLAQSKYGASFQQQEVALEALVDFYRQNEFMAEMYATMDCDLQCSNVFGDIANLISKSAFPVNSPLSTLKVLALGGLVVVVQAIAERCYEQSPHMFVNKDVALVLSYSVIMLNTDQKNVRVKKEMTEEDIKNGLVSFDLRQKEITDFFQQCYKWDVLTARSIGAAGPDNQSPNILLDDTLLVEMDKKLFTAVKIQWFNGSICYLKKLLGGMQILSKEYSQSFILRLSNLSFLISILEDKYVVEGKVMSEPEITEELKKCRNSEDNASSSFRVIASDGWDAIWPQWWEINVPDYSPTTARLIVVDYLLLVLITQLNLKLSL